MNWINRYVNAVKAHLPAKNREDVGNELTGLLEEAFKSAEEERGAPLTEEETIDWLRQRGHPGITAAGYMERRSLISEESFPLYKLVLKKVLLAVITIQVLLVGFAIFQSGNFSLLKTLFAIGDRIIEVGLFTFATVTLMFYFLGGQLSATHRLKGWDPKSLPNTRHPWEHLSYGNILTSLIFTLVFFLYLNGILDVVIQLLPASMVSGTVWGEMADGFLAYLPWINATLLASIALNAYQLFRPYWTFPTLTVDALLSLLASGIFFSLFNLDQVVVIPVAADIDTTRIEQLEAHLNLVFKGIIFGIAVFCLFDALKNLRRAFTLTRKAPTA